LAARQQKKANKKARQSRAREQSKEAQAQLDARNKAIESSSASSSASYSSIDQEKTPAERVIYQSGIVFDKDKELRTHNKQRTQELVHSVPALFTNIPTVGIKIKPYPIKPPLSDLEMQRRKQQRAKEIAQKRLIAQKRWKKIKDSPSEIIRKDRIEKWQQIKGELLQRYKAIETKKKLFKLWLKAANIKIQHKKEESLKLKKAQKEENKKRMKEGLKKIKMKELRNFIDSHKPNYSKAKNNNNVSYLDPLLKSDDAIIAAIKAKDAHDKLMKEEGYDCNETEHCQALQAQIDYNTKQWIADYYKERAQKIDDPVLKFALTGQLDLS
jgi:hypothetical protein